jgi:hypothetical protein
MVIYTIQLKMNFYKGQSVSALHSATTLVSPFFSLIQNVFIVPKYSDYRIRKSVTVLAY